MGRLHPEKYQKTSSILDPSPPQGNKPLGPNCADTWAGDFRVLEANCVHWFRWRWLTCLPLLHLATGCQLPSKNSLTASNKPSPIGQTTSGGGHQNAPGAPAPPAWPRGAGAPGTAVNGASNAPPGPDSTLGTLTTSSAGSGLLAGQVLDRLNKRPAGASIQVLDLKDTSNSPAAKIEVTADDRGFFTIQGLKPGRHYQLIARTKEGTRVFSGAVVASPPNPRLTIFLSEDVQPGEVPALPAPDLLPIKPKGATGSGPVARLMNPLAVPGTTNPFNPNPDPAPVPSATPGETARNDQGNSSGSLITSPISMGDSPKAAPAPIATNPNGGPPVLVMPAMPAGQALASQPPAPIPPSAPNATNTPVSAPTLIMPVAPPVAPVPPPQPAPALAPPPPVPAPTSGLNGGGSAPGTETALPTDRIARGAALANTSPLLSIPPNNSSPSINAPTITAPLPNTVSPAPSCVLIGNKLEQMALLDLDGKTWEFTKNRKGKVVLFDFWYSNCNPCLKSIPHLKELQRLYSPYGLEVMGLAYESGTRAEQVKKVRMVQSRLGVNYNSLLGGGDSCPVRKQFDVQSFPTLVLVDDQGTILWRSPKGQGIDRRALGEVELEIRRRLGIK